MEHTTKENAKNESLQNIHEMVNVVKQDGEVSLEYMKMYEREEMLIKQGKKLEAENTERERQRADAEKARADAEKDRADAEKDRADRAEAKIASIEKELEYLKDALKTRKNSASK